MNQLIQLQCQFQILWVMFPAGLIAASHKMNFAVGISIFFLIGGITTVIMLPSPIWFSVLDLVFAYLPMGYAAGILAVKLKK